MVIKDGDQVIKKCKVCGKEFKTSIHNKFYCSAECKTKNKRYANEKPKKTNYEKIMEITIKARAMGLEYGEYVDKYEKPLEKKK